MTAIRADGSAHLAPSTELDAELATLCESCGLCCDGSLFGRVALEADEVDRARKNRLRVLANGVGFEQSCSALVVREGDDGSRSCSVYADRPRACRRFVCRLHDRHRREGGPLAARLAAVRRVRDLVSHLEASGLTPDDFEGEKFKRDMGSEGASAASAFRELTSRLEEDFARAGDDDL